uniref:U19-Saltitoxin-Pre1c_1 n=1 Tax=Phidippus regius TaxID=1905328 RepID=A0A482Z8H3_9ARAC
MKSFLCIAVLSFCLAVCLAKTKCEEHRERELKSNTRENSFPSATVMATMKPCNVFRRITFMHVLET